MYHQFKELAGVDITTEPMEVGPTCHYVMGGVRVDADSAAATVAGLFAAGEVAGGMHGANRLGGNSLSDLLVFGRRAGIGAAEFADGAAGRRLTVDRSDIEEAIAAAVAPFDREDGENPYDLQHDLQATMQSLVGIIRTGSELEEALEKIEELEERATNIALSGGLPYNPGWNLATDLPSMLTVSRLAAQGALNRKESRGGHTRDDYPKPDAELGKVNFVQRIPAGACPRTGPVARRRSPASPSRPSRCRRCLTSWPSSWRRRSDGNRRRQHAPTRPTRSTAGGHRRPAAGARPDPRPATRPHPRWRGRRPPARSPCTCGGVTRTAGTSIAYTLPAEEGEVVLDVIHRVQATEAPDLACRWNCKAGKCGSCSAEINGKPALMCMTRMDSLPEGEAVVVAPVRTFPIIRDLVTDVSYNYEVAKRIPPFPPARRPRTRWRPAATACSRSTSSGARSSASASSASSARTSAT